MIVQGALEDVGSGHLVLFAATAQPDCHRIDAARMVHDGQGHVPDGHEAQRVLAGLRPACEGPQDGDLDAPACE